MLKQILKIYIYLKKKRPKKLIGRRKGADMEFREENDERGKVKRKRQCLSFGQSGHKAFLKKPTYMWWGCGPGSPKNFHLRKNSSK